MANATKTKTTRGFKTRCPFCGDENSLKMNVSDVEAMTCSACDNEISADDLREIIGQYAKLLAWLDTCPAIED